VNTVPGPWQAYSAWFKYDGQEPNLRLEHLKDIPLK